MCNRTIRKLGILIAIMLMASTSVVAPVVFAQYYAPTYYVNPYYVRPHYNNFYYRGYAPYAGYGYYPNYTAGNMMMAAGAGAVVGGLIGAMAARHGYRY